MFYPETIFPASSATWQTEDPKDSAYHAVISGPERLITQSAKKGKEKMRFATGLPFRGVFRGPFFFYLLCSDIFWPGADLILIYSSLFDRRITAIGTLFYY